MPQPTAPTRAIAYVRVSTPGQADHGVSLEAQTAKLTAYAQLYDLVLVDIIVDAGVSAKSLERPGLQQALTALKHGQANALLITKLDRLSRRVKDFATLIEEYFSSDKISLLSVSDSIDTRSAAGRLVLHVLMSVAEWERSVISERTCEALAHKKAKGERTGGIPYGYTLEPDGRTLRPLEAEQAIIARVWFHRASGLTIRAIVSQMAQEGVCGRTGKPFILGQIYKMLRSA